MRYNLVTLRGTYIKMLTCEYGIECFANKIQDKVEQYAISVLLNTLDKLEAAAGILD